MIDVSVIVPIYHGIKYIDQMIMQVELAAEEIDGEVELILVNDDPEEQISNIPLSEKIVIHIYNSDYNRGIHGARVKGFLISSGKYILFLDQDDKISPAYFKSQRKELGDADAVVCQVADDNKIYYNENKRLEDCICKEVMTQAGNFIVSPGQALLKRESVPSFWTENLLTCNGADDWFLWICMMCEDKVFKANEELLFWHVKHNENASSNSAFMLRSMFEVYDKLKINEYCTKEELEGIYKIVRDHEFRYIKERDKFLEMYVLLDRWMTLREQGRTVYEYFRRKGLNRVTIYGKGRFGIRLAEELKENGIEVCCFIDRNKEISSNGIMTIAPWEINQITEPIIITLVKEEAAEVCEFLKQKGGKQIYFIAEIIIELESEERKRHID